MALKAAEALSLEGYETAVIDPRFIKPLDEQLTLFYAQNADLIVTVEDHMLNGGYGSAVLELLCNHSVQIPVIRIGWPDKFVEHATTTEELQNKYGLNVETILEKVKGHFNNAGELSQKQFKIYGSSPL